MDGPGGAFSSDHARVGVCIPTVGRPHLVERVLEDLAEQDLEPAAIVVVDASDDDRTREVCERLSKRFPHSQLHWIASARGLTLQRARGVDALRQARVRYVCMLDDDVEVAADFLRLTTGFLESEEGTGFGGVSGYDVVGWGRPFEPLERLYHRVGLFDGPLRAGRWLYCGEFMRISALPQDAGTHETDYLSGGLTVWRMEVFDSFRPPSQIGYKRAEDKHFSLRVGTKYRLGVVSAARVWHEGSLSHARFGLWRMGFYHVRSRAQLLRDCDADPTLRRFVVFLAFNLVHLLVRGVIALIRLRTDDLAVVAGSAAGWAACVVAPPRRTVDALSRDRSERGRGI